MWTFLATVFGKEFTVSQGRDISNGTHILCLCPAAIIVWYLLEASVRDSITVTSSARCRFVELIYSERSGLDVMQDMILRAFSSIIMKAQFRVVYNFKPDLL